VCLRVLHIVARQRAVASYYYMTSLFICPPPNSFVFYAVRAVSKECRRLVLSRTSCLSTVERTTISARRCIPCLIRTLWGQEASSFALLADSEIIVGQINELCSFHYADLYCLLVTMYQHWRKKPQEKWARNQYWCGSGN
jgi:hypothetical protein